MIALYDVRTGLKSNNVILIYLHDIHHKILSPSIVNTKQSHIQWLVHQPHFVQSGINKDGFREIVLWDSRQLEAPVNVIISSEKSASAFIPFYDPCLPLLYMGAKGEPLVVYEFENGSLTLVERLKFEKTEVKN